MQQTILVVDDEDAIRELVSYNLKSSGYQVIEADDGHKALAAAERKVQLIVLDLMLPGIDGLEVCRKLKADPRTAHIPIIMLTAKGDEIDKVLGLELGADDYMTKPFSPRELAARVKAVLRRGGAPQAKSGELTVGRLRINFSSYEIYLNDVLLALTPKEYELMKLFLTNRGKAYSREELLDRIWGYEYYGDTRTVDVHIRHLRAKLAAAGDAIETVRGVGYRFAPTMG